MAEFLEHQRQSLEDQFFLKEDQKIIEKLRMMQKMQETKENLSRVSGIQNDHVLQTLVDLKIRPETLAPLTLIPLLEVAWADGALDEKEKQAVVSAIHQSGRLKKPEDRELLEQWLERRPSPELLTGWTYYIQGLCERLSPEEKQGLKNELMTYTRSIAEASGGFLGLGNKISTAEAEMLKKMEAAFETGH
jgi:hypothetical protein